MDITPFEIYLLLQMDTIISFLKILLFFSLMLSALAGAGWLMAFEDYEREVRNWSGRMLRLALPLLLFSSITYTLTPSTKTLVTMYSVPEVLQVLKSDKAQELGGKALVGVEKLLNSYIEEGLDHEPSTD
jgi:hypothetical protein